MNTQVDESVSVNLLFNHLKNFAYPWVMFWHGRRYTMTKVGLHHTTRDGRTLFHIFSVTDGVTYFKLQFNTETLGWRLLETDG